MFCSYYIDYSVAVCQVPRWRVHFNAAVSLMASVLHDTSPAESEVLKSPTAVVQTNLPFFSCLLIFALHT